MKGNSTDEDTQSQDLENDIDINELYEHIGAPNPLLEKDHKYGTEARTAFRVPFRYKDKTRH